jgi:cupin 2 domain-containing protein
MVLSNIFSNIPKALPRELLETLLHKDVFTLERIVSKGYATPVGEWYDQARDEWVILLKGSAGLRIEGEPAEITLKPGDHVHLPAHLKHRVEWTAPAEETVWLALHY